MILSDARLCSGEARTGKLRATNMSVKPDGNRVGEKRQRITCQWYAGEDIKLAN
jgi:hypothetical protein